MYLKPFKNNFKILHTKIEQFLKTNQKISYFLIIHMKHIDRPKTGKRIFNTITNRDKTLRFTCTDIK